MDERPTLCSTFQLIALTPPGLQDPAVAIAASRAGHLGILDLEFSNDAKTALNAVNTLSRYAGTKCGIKLSLGNTTLIDALVGSIPANISVIVFTRADSPALLKYREIFHGQNRSVVLEVTSLAAAMRGKEAGVDGLLAKGNEAAGFVGEKTSFILLQQLVKNFSLPIWVQGGIGLHTAAACYCAGASGAVLDMQLALARESSLSALAKEHISRMDGSETRCINGDGWSFRTYKRSGDASSGGTISSDDSRAFEHLCGSITWNALEGTWWPMGQDAAFAAVLARRFGSVGAILSAVQRSVSEHITSAKTDTMLSEGSPLAQAHGTRYPITQGPMARITDTPAFLVRVADGGALAFFAVSQMQPEDLGVALQEVAALMKGRPWGVGLLGFNDEQLLKSQLETIRRYSPPFAILAGGLPNQVAFLESQGIRTYVHVPSPALLDMFIDAGARKFIFEGSECGGHIGPRSSFVLWDTMVERLLARSSEGMAPQELQVLFAGGIHDSLSAAMVAALSAPLAVKGMKVGIQIGTAYLFTNEILETEAIVEAYQRNALECTGTCVLEISPGHALRSCETPYAEKFQARKKQLNAESIPTKDAHAALERLNLGRSRIASKGLMRDAAPEVRERVSPLIPVDGEIQRLEGLYMIGQVASLRDKTFSITELHRDVSDSAIERIAAVAPLETGRRAHTAGSRDVAVIGMACLFPKAVSGRAYWENILNKVNVITEIPPQRWEWQLYFDQDRERRDKIYSRWGGFVEDIPFDPLKYGIPPAALDSIEPLHLMTLEVVGAALKDAGYEDREFARDRTSVIIGTGSGVGDRGQAYILRTWLPMLFDIHSDQVLNRLQDWTEDSFPGILMNVLAGRVANRFNFGGVNYTVDAACASSLVAVYDAVRELETGSSDIVVAGGVDASQNPFTFTCFSKTNALSPTGKCRVFDEKADGTVISEGLAIVVLKRLEDAERDGDRIYAVIKSAAGSSDGRAMGLTAPRREGQMLALKRAYDKAGFSIATVGLIEAHGTGTVVGDRTEAESVLTMLTEQQAARHSCAIGSVKSMIGHTKGAAGLAGLIKAVFALHHRILPPTIGVEKPNPAVDFQSGPLYLNTETRPWFGKDEQPLRAGVNSFGFGGTNFHVVLEQYEGYGPEQGGAVEDHWPFELLFWSAASRRELLGEVRKLHHSLQSGSKATLSDIAYTHHALRRKPAIASDRPAYRLAIIASSPGDLSDKLNVAIKTLENAACDVLSDAQGVYFNARPASDGSKIAFLFPGQGSQYPGMLNDLAVLFPEVRRSFEQANRALTKEFPEGLTAHIFPPPAFTEQEVKEQKARLSRTDTAQPAIGAACSGMYNLLRTMGIRPDMTAGHSYGEYAALYASGVYDEETLCTLSAARGRFMRDAASGGDLGTMAAVRAGAEELKQHLDGIDDVVIANINAPQQTVIAGDKQAIAKAMETLKTKGIHAVPLPVSGAFHSPLVAPAKERFAAFLASVSFERPQITAFSNTTGAAYSGSPEEMKSCLTEHMVKPVQFVREIEAMYESGARIFVEVGPGSVLTNIVRQILEGRQHLAVASDAQGSSALGQLLGLVGQLAIHQVVPSLDVLYRGRNLRKLNLDDLQQEEKSQLTRARWMVNGGRIYRTDRTWSQRPQTAPLEAYRLRDRRSRRKADMEETVMPRKDTAQQPAPHPAAVKGSVAQTPMPQAGPIPVPPMSSGTELDAIMQQYQNLMSDFVEAQKTVMMAYLQGASVAPILPVSATAETPPLFALPRQASVQPGTQESPVFAEAVAAPAEAGAHAASLPAGAADVGQRIGAELLKTASERTGYPAEMLNPDLDMEADLGIDSIKRVEILSALVKGLPEAEQARVRPILDELSRLRTLKAVQEKVAGAITPESAGPVTAATAGATVQSADRLGGPAADVGLRIRDELLRIASERTGYPAEMLNPDLDMEADLGIDSIKRVEILSALVKSLPEAEQAQVRPLLDELSRLRTLKAVQERAASALGEAHVRATSSSCPAPAADMPAPANASRDEERTAPVPRYLIEPVPVAIQPEELRLSQGGTFVILDDGRGVAEAVAQKLKVLGGDAVIVRTAAASCSADPDGQTYHADLADPAAAAGLVDAIRVRHPRITGLISLSALGSGRQFDDMSLQEWRALLRSDVKGLFYLAQALGSDLRQAGKRGRVWFFAATSLASRDIAPFIGHAGIAGFMKAAAQEWPEVSCRVVHQDAATPVISLAEQLLTEMAAPEGPVEVGYPGSERVVYRTRRAELENDRGEALKIEKDWVILITGGAAGITAQVAREIAERYRPVLVLAGRSALPEKAEPAETAGLAAPKDIKAALITQLRASGTTPTPAQVEAAYARLMKDREMRVNLAAMRQAGATVHYYQTDVRNERQFAGTISTIYETFGRLDGVIHGSGIIEDKLIEDKAPDSFDRVFDTKTDSAFLLSRSIRDEFLRFIVFFTSVAGVFGNRGQSDYASANEVVNALALHLDRKWRGRVIAVNWGPWKKAGMVTPEVERQFRERGVQMIPPAAGSRMLEEEIRLGSKGDVKLVIGDGPWEQAGSGTAETPKDACTMLPLLHGSVSTEEQPGVVLLTKRMDPAHEYFLRDHLLDDKPVLPATMAVELMAEAAKCGWPAWNIASVRDVRVLKGIVIENGAKEVKISAREQERLNDGILELAVEVAESERSERLFYRSTVVLTKRPALAPGRMLSDFPAMDRFPLSVEAAYRQWLFHGPLFQCIKSIEGISDRGMVATIAPSSPGACIADAGGHAWLVDPVVLDSGPQLAILWARATMDVTVIPSRIAAIRVFSRSFPLSMRCQFEVVESSGQTVRANVHYTDDEGTILCTIEGLESTGGKSLNRLSA